VTPAVDPRSPGDTFNPETGALRVTIGAPSEIEALSDEELESILAQYGVMESELQSLDDRDLETMLKATTPPEEVGAPPEVAAPPVPLTAGEAVAGGARELAGGALFEFADEAEAAARAPFSEKSYEDILRDIRQNRARFSAEYPGTALAANVAGGVGSMFIPGAGLLGKTAQGLTGISKLASPLSRTAATGAFQGSVAGMGAGENLQERLTMGATGAGLGAGLGAGMYGAGRGAKFARDVRAAKRDTGASAEAAAADILAGRVEDPAALRQLLESDEALGVPTTLATSSPELSRLTDVVLRTPSEGREELAQTIARQQAGAPTRAQQALRTALPTPDYFASMDRVTDTLRRNANQLYGAAYEAAPEIRDPRILKALNSPDIQSAYVDALKNSQREMEAAALRGEDPSLYAMRELFEPVLDAQGALVGVNPTGKKVPDLRSLDQIKQALDRRISGLYASGQGGDASALRQVRDAFVNRLDQVGPPEYKAARAQYKGDIEIRDALELGRQAIGTKLRWQEVAKMAREASPGEQAAITTGFMQNLMQRFEDTTRRRNFAKEIIENDNLRNKLRVLTPPEEFKVLEASLKREAELFDQTSRVMTGSQTFERAAEASAIENAIASGQISPAVDMLMNPTPGNLFRKAAQILGDMRNANVSRAAYGQLAKMLNTSTPQEAEAVLTQLERAAPARARREQAFEERATRAGTAGARIIAPSPETEREQEEEFRLNIPSIRDGLSAMPGDM
jgi:hypothetical protein